MNPLLAMCSWELKRTLTAGRIGWWAALTAFPSAIVLLVRCQGEFGEQMTQAQVDSVWSIVSYMLIPCVCCGMGVFLNAAPAIASELEQRSWIYLATRPRGILWLMLGKYLVAVVWTFSSAAASVSLATLLTEADLSVFGVRSLDMAAGYDEATRPEALFRLWFTMLRLSLLSVLAYGALYLMIGALFPKRAMVFSVAYTALVEVVLSLIPAIINRLTIQFRLRSLMMNWAEPEGREQLQNNMFFRYVFAEGSNPEQVLWLFALTGTFLAVAVCAGHFREFTSASESDV